MGSTGPKNLGDLDVLVVGGGFCGTWQLHTLRNEGFKVLLVEAGNALGGIWYWNNYPGARVDCSVPTYQFTEPGDIQNYDWKQSYPDRHDLVDYFRHVDKVWNLSKDVRYGSRVTSLTWDPEAKKWRGIINDGEAEVSAWNVVLCTGFASKRYTPTFKNLSAYKGEIHHTAVWPQEGVSLKDREVAIIGTGASGVQAIQEVAKQAKHLVVFQRTPNMALPMLNPDPDNAKIREEFPKVRYSMRNTFSGFEYTFMTSSVHPTKLPKEERLALYEKFYHAGGLHLWLAPWMDILFDESLNEEVYQFWRSKTISRIHDPVKAEILAPEKKIHPFGTKRISLEKGFFEVFNEDHVELVDLRSNAIQEFTETGIRTADGQERKFDLVILATGFDSLTGGIKQIDIRNENGESISDKWEHGTYTNLGITTAGFPNLFFTYGPQAPTAFATGPASAETQGAWIVEALLYMRHAGIKSMEATREAEQEWRQHVNDIANMSLLPKADSWYMGANIPGKPREALNYLGGLPEYRRKLWDECAKKGYEGFVLS